MTTNLRSIATLSVTTLSLLAGAAVVAGCSSAPDPATAKIDEAYKCSAISGCGTGGGGSDCGGVGEPPCLHQTCAAGLSVASDGTCEPTSPPPPPPPPPCGTPGYPVCTGASSCSSGVDVDGICYATLEQVLSFTSGAASGNPTAQDSSSTTTPCSLTLDDVAVPPDLAGMGCSMGRTYTWPVGVNLKPTTFWACTSFSGATTSYTALTDPYKSACLGKPSSGYTLVGSFNWDDPSNSTPNTQYLWDWHVDNMGAGGPCLPPFDPNG